MINSTPPGQESRSPGARLEDVFGLIEQDGEHVRRGNLRFALSELYRGTDLRGRSVLDIGAGHGHASLFAGCAGATRVVALEPEAAGSSGGMLKEFDRLNQMLDLSDRVELLPVTFQAYDPGVARFDVLTLNASINHLDEAACIRLDRDAGARDVYHAIFAKLDGVAAPGATLVISDCSRRNLFGDLGLRNPIAPSIEWHKHQSPQLWASLLEEHGFRLPRIRWQTFNSLRTPGRLLLGNRAAAYMLTSTFCLTMVKA